MPKASLTLCERVRSTAALNAAWHAIRRNAATSRTRKTRLEAQEYGREVTKNLQAIQRQLRRGYEFEKPHGATPSKGGGKAGKRPIVVAPLKDRIVQRSILDVLQSAIDLPSVQRVLATPTSIGGIKGRGVDDAIQLFDDCHSGGHRFVAGSDIAGFFQKIRPADVIAFLKQDVTEQPFLDLVQRALTVELSNADRLSPEDRKLFPTGDDGVAQGCPLSALAGNIVLEGFDAAMNDAARGVTCIRYIDDFIITGVKQKSVLKALDSAKTRLASLGMAIYDPVTHPTKAFSGPIGLPHVFLGYQLLPDRYPPSPASSQRLLDRVDQAVASGKVSIRKILRNDALRWTDRCYAQTIADIDNIVRGWRGSYRASLCQNTFSALDRQIEQRLGQFEIWFHAKTKLVDAARRRQALGVGLLQTL